VNTKSESGNAANDIKGEVKEYLIDQRNNVTFDVHTTNPQLVCLEDI